MSRALVVGSEGQDGRLLRDRLAAEGFEVAGIDRTGSPGAPAGGPAPPADVLDAASVRRLVKALDPGEVYYLAAFHHSAEDRELLEGAELYRASHAVHVEGLLNVLEALRREAPRAGLFYAASCLVFGEPAGERQTESTPFDPRCIYGITKTAGIHACRFYRRTHGVAASSGILYNHESPLRQPGFLSQRVVRGAVDIRLGRTDTLVLGDLAAVNDWGWAEDTVDAMIRIVRCGTPDDYVVSTGEPHSVRDLVEAVFRRAGLDWRRHVREEPDRIARRRPPLIGDASRLRSRTGWAPRVGFEEMCARLWDAAWAEAAARPS